ncbi:recombinase family protein [Chthonobacter rhizosphaerae]|uniref:recombinase family protein n=1 Tax=Chthonobacter rhizosphaerae TaxID=2735553 RepID=UPI0031B594D1
MIIGYGRTSTADQTAGLEAQMEQLQRHGCAKLFIEQVSSVDASRPQMAAALEFVREGDQFVVTKLDRLARSVPHLMTIVQHLDQRKVGLRILDLNIDTTTPTGKLLLNLLGSVAQFEREIMLERQRHGITKAKAEGRYEGWAPTAVVRPMRFVTSPLPDRRSGRSRHTLAYRERRHTCS